MMFPFPKIDNNMILIVSVFLIIYVLTLETTKKSIKKKIKVDTVKSSVTPPNPFPTSEQDFPSNPYEMFTMKCNDEQMMPAGGAPPCREDEEFTQKQGCPTLDEMLNSRNIKQKEIFKKARDDSIPFPKSEGAAAEVQYIGNQENEDWFNGKQYDTIQRTVQDPSRQMKASYGNAVPNGGDTRPPPDVEYTGTYMYAPISTHGVNKQISRN